MNNQLFLICDLHDVKIEPKTSQNVLKDKNTDINGMLKEFWMPNTPKIKLFKDKNLSINLIYGHHYFSHLNVKLICLFFHVSLKLLQFLRGTKTSITHPKITHFSSDDFKHLVEFER